MTGAADQVTQVLRKAQRRAALLGSVSPSVILLGAGLLVWGGVSLFSPARSDEIGLAAMVASGLAIAALTGVRLVMAPSLLRVARRADRELGLFETLSTALGLHDATGPVGRALDRRATEISARLDVRKLSPLGARSLAFAVSFLIVGCLVAAVGYFDAPGGVPARTAVEDVQKAGHPAVTSDELDAVAALLAEDAKRKNSDYLAAVSHSVQQLAEQIQTGASPQDVAAQLQTLLEHAKAGYDGQLPSWLQGNSSDTQSLLQKAQAFSEARREAALAREAEAGGKPRAAGGLSSDMYKLSDDRLLRSASDLPQGDNSVEGKTSDERQGSLESGPLGGSSFTAERMESEQLDNAGALPIGGAAQSGKGESNIAGGGSQPLLDDAGFLQSMPDPTSEMALTAADPQADGHIRLYVPTAAEMHDTGGAAGGATDFARQAAQAVDRQAVAGDAAAVVARYFNNAPDTDGGSAP